MASPPTQDPVLESFPLVFDEAAEAQATGTLDKLKRFFRPLTASFPTATVSPSSTPASTPALEGIPAVSHVEQPRDEARSPRGKAGQAGRVPFPTEDSIPEGLVAPIRSREARTLKSEPARRPRSIRLSGVSPSVRLTVANSQLGEVVQSSASSFTSESKYGEERDKFGLAGGGGGTYGSPSGSDSFAAHLSHIPGFPINTGDDSRSIRSVTTTSLKPMSSSVVGVFRKLRGEGLSKEYWISDESSKECFDCQTVFSSFRRKHHCRICGQIFCSRCASNLISGARFGLQSVRIRVCNLCVSIMDDNEPAPDEHTIPPRSTFRDSNRPLISSPLEASARPHHAHFPSPRQFYSRPETHYSGASADDGSRSGTPNGLYEEDSPNFGRAVLTSPKSPEVSSFSNKESTAVAPFRRGIVEEDKAGEIESPSPTGLGISSDGTATTGQSVPQIIPQIYTSGATLATSLVDPPPPSPATLEGDPQVPLISVVVSPEEQLLGSVPLQQSSSSNPYFPLSSPASVPAVLPSVSQISATVATSDQSHFRSATPLESGFVFHDFPHDGPGPDPRSLQRILANSGPYQQLTQAPVEISDDRRSHIRRILLQCLQQAEIPNPDSWEKPLLKLLDKVSKYPKISARPGENFNIRRYVRIKRIPGGVPRDSEYVNGIVFTKNLLHKQMPRHLAHPRIMLLSFQLEYQRIENQLMSLDPILKQEREVLRNLVARIVARRPQIVLVEKNVSSIALEYLMDAKVAVARNVKSSVIEAVARLTQADIVSSIDKLVLEPRLGRCEEFNVQTFVHSMIPGRKKTFMRFEGCAKELGCTLVLRGGSIEVLTKVKRIVDLLVHVVYSSKLEASLLRDELVAVLPPDSPPLAQPVSDPTSGPQLSQSRAIITHKIANSLRPYQETAFSGSPYVVFRPPHPLVKMQELDQRATELRHAHETEEAATILHEEEVSRKEASENLESAQSDTNPQIRSRANSILEKPIATFDEALKILQTPQDLKKESDLREVEEAHAQQLLKWESYVSHRSDSLDPADHQTLFVLESTSSSQTARLCSPPSLRAISFYGKNDTTIGQFIETTRHDLSKLCPMPNCQKQMATHSRMWVHDKLRVEIVPETPVAELNRLELNEEFLMYGRCKQCGSESSMTIMSEETRNASFGKFLEYLFYQPNVVRFDSRCDHNSFVDYVRYWRFYGLVLQITCEPIPLSTIIPPPLALQIRPEQQLQVRNEEYVTLLKKSLAFWNSIVRRISSFNYDLVQSDRIEECRTALAELSGRSSTDRRANIDRLEQTYEQTRGTNGTQMMAVRQWLQEKAAAWETEWVNFEQKLLTREKDVRRITTSQLKRLFSEDDGLALSPERPLPSSSLATALELDESASEGGLPTVQLEQDILSSSVASSSSTVLSVSPNPLTSFPRSPTTRDDDSDSTVCADVAPSLLTPGAVSRGGGIISTTPLEDTSGAESEYDQPAWRRGDSRLSVADRVRMFSEGEAAASDDSTRGSLASRPGLRRGPNDYPRSIKSRTADVFSDGDGLSSSYARNVGIAHLANQSPAGRPSRIGHRRITPSQPGSNLASLFNAPPPTPLLLDPTFAKPSKLVSPSSSRPVSRAGVRAGKSGGSISAHRVAAEGSNVTLKASSSGKGRSQDGGGTSNDDRAPSTLRAKGGSHLGISRPTTSSANKAIAPRRVGSGTVTRGAHVSQITQHFERLTQVPDREQRRRRLAIHRAEQRVRPIQIKKPIIKVFTSYKEAAKEDSDDDDDSDSSDGADDEDEDELDPMDDEFSRGRPRVGAPPPRYNLKTEAAETVPTTALTAPTTADTPQDVDLQEASIPKSGADSTDTELSSRPPSPRQLISFPRLSEGESSGNERGSTLIKAISNLWTYRLDLTPLDYPLHSTEHIFGDNILVREEEPSSAIAFTLKSKEYIDKLREASALRVVVKTEEEASTLGGALPGDRSSSWELVDYDGKGAEETLKDPEAKHFKFQFVEGKATLGITIFFGEQFDALRRNCGCSEQFIESLARCVSWTSVSGGRSKVDFLKTKDDRFIIKEISPPEMESLLAFAPAYFEYISKALFHGLPTTLTKIFGFYRLSIKNKISKREIKLDVLVMENLFYGRNKLTHIFDLKGSTRNRHVHVSPEKPHEVLLDLNLVEMSYNKPLYVREASKGFLLSAIHNDSLFLSKLNVMDYSLVVGVDSQTQELVVGIVDFIRTYSWDKKAEHWIKSSTFLGGGESKPPTVISPQNYKNRFREAMAGYFLLAPDPWLDSSFLNSPSTKPTATDKEETFITSLLPLA